MKHRYVSMFKHDKHNLYICRKYEDHEKILDHIEYMSFCDTFIIDHVLIVLLELIFFQKRK